MRWFLLISLVGLASAGLAKRSANEENSIVALKNRALTEAEATTFLEEENKKLAEAINEITTAQWAQDSNITDENEAALVGFSNKFHFRIL